MHPMAWLLNFNCQVGLIFIFMNKEGICDNLAFLYLQRFAPHRGSKFCLLWLHSFEHFRLKDRHGCDGRSNSRAQDQEIQEEEEVWAQLDLLVLITNNLLQGLHAGADGPEDAVEADQSIEE